jgi:signal transduction histidine kinase
MTSDELFDGSPLSPTARQFLDMGEAITWRWEREARARILGAVVLPRPVLMATVSETLGVMAESLTPDFPCVLAAQPSAASAHGSARARNTSFGSEQIAQEYRILRESIVITVYSALDLTARQWSGIDHLIDWALCESLRAFASEQKDLRRKLTASISHDMRTPLSVVLNGAQLAQRSGRPELTKRLAGKIASNANRLKDMVSELLDTLTFTCGGRFGGQRGLRREHLRKAPVNSSNTTSKEAKCRLRRRSF